MKDLGAKIQADLASFNLETQDQEARDPAGRKSAHAGSRPRQDSATFVDGGEAGKDRVGTSVTRQCLRKMA